MKKNLYLIIFCIEVMFCKIEKYGIGDPFVYINSSIPELKTKAEFLTALEDQTKIIAIVSYNNNFYGNDFDIFSKMARIYGEISALFGNQKNIKFYRVNMLKGISGCLLSRAHSCITFFYQNECIGKLDENEKKNMIVKYISDLIKKIFN